MTGCLRETWGPGSHSSHSPSEIIRTAVRSSTPPGYGRSYHMFWNLMDIVGTEERAPDYRKAAAFLVTLENLKAQGWKRKWGAQSSTSLALGVKTAWRPQIT